MGRIALSAARSIRTEAAFYYPYAGRGFAARIRL